MTKEVLNKAAIITALLVTSFMDSLNPSAIAQTLFFEAPFIGDEDKLIIKKIMDEQFECWYLNLKV